MINNLLKKITLLIPTFIATIFVSIIWKKIKFTFENPSEVIGYYSLFEHSHLNDSIRFVVFISIPLITFFLTIFVSQKESFINLIQNFLIVKKEEKKEKISIFFLLIFFLILLFKFFSSELSLHPVDLFHDGQSFMGAINYELKIDRENKTNIIINAIMDKNRYLKKKKYKPRISDCNIVRNKIITNKFGYSPITSKPNYSITEDVLFEYIKNNIFNIQNLNEDEIKSLIKKTTIKINIIHPISKFNINCSGKLSDAELY